MTAVQTWDMSPLRDGTMRCHHGRPVNGNPCRHCHCEAADDGMHEWASLKYQVTFGVEKSSHVSVWCKGCGHNYSDRVVMDLDPDGSTPLAAWEDNARLEANGYRQFRPCTSPFPQNHIDYLMAKDGPTAMKRDHPADPTPPGDRRSHAPTLEKP